MTAAVCAVGLLLALLPPGVQAVGPQAPFTPPAPPARPAAAPMAAPLPAGAASDAESAAAPPGLVGLRLGNAPAALIDGTWVRVGQTVRDARLIEVLPSAVRLRHADGRLETVALFTDSSAAALTPRRVVVSLPVASRELP